MKYLITVLCLPTFLAGGEGKWTKCSLYGGNVTSFAINESSPIYAGTWGGGMFMSKNRGDLWEEINNGLEEVPFIQIVSVAPSNPNVIYIGDLTVAGGKGIYKSVDGGLSWQSLDMFQPVSLIAIDPSSPQTIYISYGILSPYNIPSRTLFKTTDGGDTWIDLYKKLPDTLYCINDLIIDPKNSNIIYVAAGNISSTLEGQGKLYKSIDGGRIWKRYDVPIPNDYQKSPAVLRVVVDPNNPQIIYALALGWSHARWCRSDDGGETWSFYLPEDFPGDIAIHPANPKVIYMKGSKDIIKTTDGGETWEKLLIPDSLKKSAFTHIEIDPNDPEILYVSNSLQGMIRSRDGGKTWKVINKGLTAGYIINLVICKNTLFAVQSGGIHRLLKSEDKGKTWQIVGIEGRAIEDIVVFDSSLFVVTDSVINSSPYTVTSQKIFQTIDGGESWREINVPYVDSFSYLTTMAMDPQNPETWYVGMRGRIIKTTDNGVTWDTTALSPIYDPYRIYEILDIACDPSNPNTIHFGGRNASGIAEVPVIFMSYDDLRTYQESPLMRKMALWEGDAITAIVYAPSDPKILYVAGCVHIGIWKSTDGGRTSENWKYIGIYPRDIFSRVENISDIAVHPDDPNILYVAMWPDLAAGDTNKFCGIYRSPNGGESWEEFDRGLGTSFVNKIVLDPENPERLYAATSGRGVVKYTFPGGVEEKLPIVKRFFIECLPNPAKGIVDVRYEVPVKGVASLKLYDVSGRVVKILLRAKSLEPGVYEMNINAKDISNGVYFLQLSTSNYSLTKKVLIFK